MSIQTQKVYLINDVLYASLKLIPFEKIGKEKKVKVVWIVVKQEIEVVDANEFFTYENEQEALDNLLNYDL